MQFDALTQGLELREQDGVFDERPTIGSIPEELIAPLATTLTTHTTSSDAWFAVWEGLGAIRGEVRVAPTFDLPHRRYHLLSGPLAALSETVMTAPWMRSANLVWPPTRRGVSPQRSTSTPHISAAVEVA
jgi:hypothetical protein